MELDDPILSQTPEYPVDMDEGQARGISDIFLGQGKVHLFDLAAGPLRAVSDEQFEHQMGNTLTRRMATNAGESIESQAAIPCDQPREPQAQLRAQTDKRKQGLVRYWTHDRIGQGLGAVCHHRAIGGMEAEYGARECKMQNLPSAIF